MNKQYISDIVTNKDIAQWLPRDRILFSSQTGTGKSQWVKDNLKDYAIKTNKKILLLSNRTILKKQNINELGYDNKNIELKNYQSIESSIIYGNNLKLLFQNYYYIVFDECHYLLNDSSFNRNTDLLLNKLNYPDSDKIFIFMTATPEAIQNYHNNFEYKYTIPKDYSYIKNLYFYSKQDTVENIIRHIPKNEQILYFGNAIECYDLHNIFIDNSNFICSDNNTGFSKRSNVNIIKEIEREGIFSNQILFATKVLDNGINLISPSLKHIFIDMINPIDVIQCLGRKRIVNDDYINLYIKNHHNGNILTQLKYINNNLSIVRELTEIGKEEFSKKYNRQPIDNIIHNDYTINIAKLEYSKYFSMELNRMFHDDDKIGYQKKICSTLRVPVENIKIAENYYESITLIDILNKYANRKLFKDDIENFKIDFFDNLFNPQRRRNIRSRGYNCINSILQEDELPYNVISIKEKERDENRDKHYWWLSKIEQLI